MGLNFDFKIEEEGKEYSQIGFWNSKMMSNVPYTDNISKTFSLYNFLRGAISKEDSEYLLTLKKADIDEILPETLKYNDYRLFKVHAPDESYYSDVILIFERKLVFMTNMDNFEEVLKTKEALKKFGVNIIYKLQQNKDDIIGY